MTKRTVKRTAGRIPKPSRERAEKASISMPHLLFELARQRQVQLGFATFSDYVQSLTRNDVVPRNTESLQLKLL